MSTPPTNPILAATAALLACWPSAEAAVQEQSAPRPRSVVFYLMDTCRNDRLECSGYHRETSPFLEWLAERSVTFEACYSQAPWTKPSMASILSSRHPSATGIHRMEQRLPASVTTWPEVLDANGYTTVGFSANIVMGDILSDFAQGFDHFVESTEINRGDPIRFASGSARKLNERAFAWLNGNDAWPLLLYMHSVDPHEEYEPEPPYLERFADPERHPAYREEWRRLLESRPPIPGLYVTQDNFDRTGIAPGPFIAHGSDLYDGDVRANDDQLRLLWDRLQQDGWGEDLVFVFTSDHGEEFFEHGGTSHGYSLYDEMVRVPLLIHAPGLVPGGLRIPTPVESIDIYPTLCELLGLETPAGLSGRSLLPLIRGEESAGERLVFFEHTEDPILRAMGHGSGVLAGVRDGRWKLIVNERSSQLLERPLHELYDLESDPGEQNNVASEHPEVVERLAGELAAHLRTQRGAQAARAEGSLPSAALEQLRALGYVGEDEAPELWDALRGGRLDDVRRSLRAGADPDELEPRSGLSPLGAAALRGDVQLAELLLARGAKVDVRNQDGATPLIAAAFLGRTEVLELLLQRGADRTLRNQAGDTALTATEAPWEITAYIIALMDLPLERAEVEAGRERCAELLRAPAPDDRR